SWTNRPRNGPVSIPPWCACRWGSKASTTSSATSTRASRRQRRRRRPRPEMTTQSTSVERILGFGTDSGHTFGTVEIAYETFGTLNSDRSNAILIEHALTGDTHVTEWWAGIVGPGEAVDTDEYYVVSASSLGVCSGSSGQQSTFDAGLAYGSRLHAVSILDMSRLERHHAQTLAIESWVVVFGCSMGWARDLEFALL